MPSQQSDAVQNNDHSWAQAGGFSVGKSYNAQAGVLTITGTSQLVSRVTWKGDIAQATQSGTAFAYLVKR